MKFFYQSFLIFLIVFCCVSCNSFFRKQTDQSLRYLIEVGPQDSPEKLQEILRARLESIFLEDDILVEFKSGKISVLIENWDSLAMSRQHVKRLISASGNLEFWETYENSEIISSLLKADSCLAKNLTSEYYPEKEIPAQPGDSVRKPDPWDVVPEEGNARMQHPLFFILAPSIDPRGGQMLPGPVVGRSLIRDTARVMNYLGRNDVRNLLHPGVVFKWYPIQGVDSVFSLLCLHAGGDGQPAMSNVRVEDVESEPDKYSGVSCISFRMKSDDAVKWKKTTAENIGRSIAVVIDGKVFSYPTVQNEITGGMCQITGGFTPDETRSIVAMLRSGISEKPRVLSEEVIAKPK